MIKLTRTLLVLVLAVTGVGLFAGAAHGGEGPGPGHLPTPQVSHEYDVIPPHPQISFEIIKWVHWVCAPASYDVPVSQLTQSQAEHAVRCLTNEKRAAHGVQVLAFSGILRDTARSHAQAAVTLKWWDQGADMHVNPQTGLGPHERMQQAGYCSGANFASGENTYWGWGSVAMTPRNAVDWWMGSPGHKANLLNPTFKHLGVGVVLGAPRQGNFPNAAVFVQNFGSCAG